MATNKEIINMENITEWLASTGFLFPSNEMELERFNKLYPDVENEVIDYNINIERILSGNTRSLTIKPVFDQDNIASIRQYKMVARFGKSKQLPPNIMDKIKKNEAKKKNDASDQKEEN